jgi:hypothetical protein
VQVTKPSAYDRMLVLSLPLSFLLAAMALSNVYAASTTPVVMKAIYHTAVQRRVNSTHLATIWDWPTTTPPLSKRTPGDDMTSSFTAEIAISAWHTHPYEAHTKRSANLYTLQLPFTENKGYIDILLPNTTVVPFCKDVPDTLYEDSLKMFHTLTIHVGMLRSKFPCLRRLLKTFVGV